MHRKSTKGGKRIHIGEMAEWSIAAVLKTVEGHTSGGSNPSLSASEKKTCLNVRSFFDIDNQYVSMLFYAGTRN